MTSGFGYNIHYCWLFMVLTSCAMQEKNQEEVSAFPDSTIKKEICVLPTLPYNNSRADFDMREFNFQTDKETVVPALKKLGDAHNTIYSSYLPAIPYWMDSKYANDSLYRKAYLSYVRCFVNNYQQNGINIQKLYVDRNSQQAQFATVEELAAVVKCQIHLVDSMPDAKALNQKWIILSTNK